MALRWLVTRALTGEIVDEVDVESPSLTTDLDRSRATVDLRIGHMIRLNETLDLPRAMQVAGWIEPAGAYALACIDMEDNAGWRGQYDRVLGEWLIRSASPATGEAAIPVAMEGLLAAAGDRLLERDYRETGMASWIIADLLQAALGEYQVAIPKPNVGPVIPVDWRAGRVTYAQAVQDVQRASGVEVMVRHSLELTGGSPTRIRRDVVMGMPIRVLNDQRAIDVGGNGIKVRRPVSIEAWANSVNVYGAGSGDDQIAGNAFRGKPAGMPTVSRSFSHPDVQANGLAKAMAAGHLADMTGVEPLQVECLRTNWTNKYPVIGDAHRVIVDPCLAFPWGIDGIYRVTRIEYQPRDTAPDTLRLTMEVSP